MKIKKNDTVKIIAGKDKGKSGKVMRALPEDNAVIVDGLNLVVKHVKPRNAGEKGQKMYFPKPISTSKLMIVCDKCGQPTRVGYRMLDGESRAKKERFCKKCKQLLTV